MSNTLEVLKRYNNARIMFYGEDQFKDGNVIVARGFIEDPDALRVYGYEDNGEYRALSRAIVDKHEIDAVEADMDGNGNVVLRPAKISKDD